MAEQLEVCEGGELQGGNSVLGGEEVTGEPKFRAMGFDEVGEKDRVVWILCML